MLKILDIATDSVIKSKVLSTKSNYDYSLTHIYPLINKLGIQRNILNKSFYIRLENDIIKGCIMPPLTLAIVGLENKDNINTEDETDFTTFIENNIDKIFVLDGIQRLNTLKKASETLEFSSENRKEQTIYYNIILCDSMNELLYRMITLNNGQQAMSVKHQIEILTQNLINLKSLEIEVQTEKERKEKIDKNAFSQSDLTLAFLAFLAQSINIDNQKIIDTKMNEILINKVIENEIINSNLEFYDVINNIIAKYSSDNVAFKWFNNKNNLIGFSVGIHKSYSIFKEVSLENFVLSLNYFEDAFKSLKVSKIKVSTIRRKLAKYFFENYEELHKKVDTDLVEIFLDNDLI